MAASKSPSLATSSGGGKFEASSVRVVSTAVPKLVAPPTRLCAVSTTDATWWALAASFSRSAAEGSCTEGSVESSSAAMGPEAVVHRGKDPSAFPSTFKSCRRRRRIQVPQSHKRLARGWFGRKKSPDCLQRNGSDDSERSLKICHWSRNMNQRDSRRAESKVRVKG